MSKKGMPRRTFMASSMLLGNTLFGLSLDLGAKMQVAQKAKEILSPDEEKWIDGSTLAQDLGNYFGQNYSCAESLLMVSLRSLGKPEEWVWAASGFGGGMYKRDLCGFLTGGIIALGFASGMLKMPRKNMIFLH